jgi:gluconokinase
MVVFNSNCRIDVGVMAGAMGGSALVRAYPASVKDDLAGPIGEVRTVILAGVSGCGKSTIGELLAGRLGWQFVDGDSLHSPASIAKMTSGQPLTDQDRESWLRLISERIDTGLARGQRSVITCSALKRRFRADLLHGRPDVRMIFLAIDAAEVRRRLHARTGHFFTAGMLDSQFAALEPPGEDEERVVILPVLGPPDQIADEIIRTLSLRPGHE